MNGDGTPDLIAVAGPGGGSQVRVIDGRDGDRPARRTYSTFEPAFTGGLFVAAADLDRDGRAEVIVTPDRGGGGRVVVLAAAGGSARVAGQLLRDRRPELPRRGPGGGRGRERRRRARHRGRGRVRRRPAGRRLRRRQPRADSPRKLVNDFFAFDGPDALSLRNGVFVAAGDLNADGRADLIFGGGPGGGPRVFALSGALLTSSPDRAKATPLANFFASPASERGGVRLAVKDVTRDGVADLVVGTGEDVAARLTVYAGGAFRWAGGAATTASTADPFGFAIPMDGVYIG